MISWQGVCIILIIITNISYMGFLFHSHCLICPFTKHVHLWPQHINDDSFQIYLAIFIITSIMGMCVISYNCESIFHFSHNFRDFFAITYNLTSISLITHNFKDIFIIIHNFRGFFAIIHYFGFFFQLLIIEGLLVHLHII